MVNNAIERQQMPMYDQWDWELCMVFCSHLFVSHINCVQLPSVSYARRFKSSAEDSTLQKLPWMTKWLLAVTYNVRATNGAHKNIRYSSSHWWNSHDKPFFVVCLKDVLNQNVFISKGILQSVITNIVRILRSISLIELNTIYRALLCTNVISHPKWICFLIYTIYSQLWWFDQVVCFNLLLREAAFSLADCKCSNGFIVAEDVDSLNRVCNMF